MTIVTLTDDILQQIACLDDKIKRLEQSIVPKVSVRAYNDANISIATSGTPQALTFNKEYFDHGDCHSEVSNTGRLTVPITGLYVIGAQVAFASNATGYREVDLRVNGTDFIVVDDKIAISGVMTMIDVETIEELDVGDYVEVIVKQTSGGALNVLAGSSYSPVFWMFLKST